MEYPQNEAGGAAKKEYNRALRQAFWRKLHRRLIQQVPLERIVGSGRSRDFDLVFNPKRREQDGRWIQVAQANLNGVTLPPPRLLKIERSYLVVDGNHRISVARAMGRTFIQASVVEIEVENIEPRPACSRLGFHIKTTDDCAANDCR
jgi:hypothetical protein